jgi:hypothetical protein
MLSKMFAMVHRSDPTALAAVGEQDGGLHRRAARNFDPTPLVGVGEADAELHRRAARAFDPTPLDGVGEADGGLHRRAARAFDPTPLVGVGEADGGLRTSARFDAFVSPRPRTRLPHGTTRTYSPPRRAGWGLSRAARVVSSTPSRSPSRQAGWGRNEILEDAPAPRRR